MRDVHNFFDIRDRLRVYIESQKLPLRIGVAAYAGSGFFVEIELTDRRSPELSATYRLNSPDLTRFFDDNDELLAKIVNHAVASIDSWGAGA